jgi:hypothetical protein
MVTRKNSLAHLKNLRPPGIEPGANAWEALMLPLHQERMTFCDEAQHPLYIVYRVLRV